MRSGELLIKPEYMRAYIDGTFPLAKEPLSASVTEAIPFGDYLRFTAGLATVVSVFGYIALESMNTPEK